MVTDNWPVDFRYISRRLVREIVDQHGAATPEHRIKIGGTAGINVGPINVGVTTEMSKRPVDYDNIYDLAKRATAAVSDHTGYLDPDDPFDRIPTGNYIRARMHLQVQKVPLGVWEDAYNHPIAAFVGYENLNNFGRVFVGLVGSASNFMHLRLDQSRATRTPSDALGLYDIIQQSRELTAEGILEPGISARQLDRERKHCPTERDRYQAAAELFQGIDISAYSELLECLIRVHHVDKKVDLHIIGKDGRWMRAFDRVILGAPVWVSTPEPRRDDALLTSRQAIGELPGTSTHGQARPVRLTPVPGPNPYDPPFAHLMGPTDPVSHDVESVTLPQAPALKRTSNWALYDAHLTAYLEAASRREPNLIIEGWPRCGSLWREFREWFVDQAYRFGPDPLPLAIPSRRFRIARLGFGWSEGSLEPSGKFGWYAPYNLRSATGAFRRDPRGVIVLTDGSVWPAFENGGYLGPRGRPRPLDPDIPHPQAASAILRTAARYRTPLLGPDQVIRVEIASETSARNRGND